MDSLLELILHTDDALITIVAENIIYAYLVLFIIIVLETGLIVFPFLPGDGLLFSAGVVAASTDLNVWILLIILIIAAVLGNFINYYIGNLIGNKLIASNNYFVKKFLVTHIPKTHQFYEKNGGKAIIIGRFFPIIRTYMPFFAGIVKMEKKLFTTFTVIGAVTWISLFLFAGFFVGDIEWVKNNYGLIFLSLIFISLLPLLVSIIRKLTTNAIYNQNQN